jgi:hypothetical protein
MNELTIKYYFTGYQLLYSGEQIPFNTFAYDTIPEYKKKYATEMQYAIDAVDTIAGYVIIVYDSNGNILIQDPWFRATEEDENAE